MPQAFSLTFGGRCEFHSSTAATGRLQDAGVASVPLYDDLLICNEVSFSQKCRIGRMLKPKKELTYPKFVGGNSQNKSTREQ